MSAADRPFVWPPRSSGDLTGLGDLAPGQGAEHQHAPAAPAPLVAEHLMRSGARVNRVRAAWHEAEDAWLGVTRRSFDARAIAEGWVPSEASAYCARCGLSAGPLEAAGAASDDGPSCRECRDTPPAWDRLVRIGEYHGILRDAIHDLKFDAWRRVGIELGRALGSAVRSRLGEEGIDVRSAVIVPIPMTFRRWMVRGVDHTLVLARAVGRQTGIPVVRAMRRRHRPSQLDVPRSSRAANAAGSMRAVRVGRLLGKTVLVLDDVITTGATMNAACRTLREGLRSCRRIGEGPPLKGFWAVCVARAAADIREPPQSSRF